MRCFALAVLLLGCNSSQGGVDIRASNYDQTCAQASDCMIISEGSCCPQCAFAAISKDGSAPYQADAKKRASVCQGAKCQQPPCSAPQPICTDGKCGLCLGQCFDAGSKPDASSDASSDAASDASSDATSDAPKD